MLFLSGATIPLVDDAALGADRRAVHAGGLSGERHARHLQRSTSRCGQLARRSAALLLTLASAIFVAMRLFRWEKDEKLKGSAKLWVAGSWCRSSLLGVYQFRTSEQIGKNRDAVAPAAARRHVPDPQRAHLRRRRPRHRERLGARAQRQDRGGLRRRRARRREPRRPTSSKASGKTVLPGLIDVHVHLGAPGGFYADCEGFRDRADLRARRSRSISTAASRR